ncbi:MAG: hypothetical protein IKZ51_04855 [Bacteroidales bacterium]|nr:hypothetical protein [Bacteroidales bacterium]
MRNWEDILKNKLERYEKPLQEGSLARFQARRNAESITQSSRRTSILWVAGAAVAAILAAVLLFRQPVRSDLGIQIDQQPEQTVASLSDSVDTYITGQESAMFAQVENAKNDKGNYDYQHDNHITTEDKYTPECDRTVEELENIASDTVAESTTEVAAETVEIAAGTNNETDGMAPSPIVPDIPYREPLNLEVSYAAAGVAADGAAAALVEAGLFALIHRDYCPRDNGRSYDHHYLPLRTGLSLRFPLLNNLNITSGINYSLYLSQFHNAYDPTKYTQIVHYLGVPVRLDGTLAQNRWFDVYVGGGFEADFYIHGREIEEEWGPYGGLELSLITVGGIQYNLTKNLGVYIEPELNWIVSRVHGPYTFRKYPLSLSVSTGIRISFNR